VTGGKKRKKEREEEEEKKREETDACHIQIQYWNSSRVDKELAACYKLNDH
jgi:hypothetical protein